MRLNTTAQPSASVAATGVRMMVIQAFANPGPDGQPDVTVGRYPVVGLTAECRDGGVFYDALVVDRERGIVPAEALDACNCATELVACQWTPAEDDERLARVEARVRAEAIRRVMADATGRKDIG